MRVLVFFPLTDALIEHPLFIGTTIKVPSTTSEMDLDADLI